MFCKYSDIFGKPKTGVHSFRLFNFAIVDVLLTLVLAYYLTNNKNNYNDVFNTFFILIIMSFFIHKLFCVETTLTKFLT